MDKYLINGGIEGSREVAHKRSWSHHGSAMILLNGQAGLKGLMTYSCSFFLWSRLHPAVINPLEHVQDTSYTLAVVSHSLMGLIRAICSLLVGYPEHMLFRRKLLDLLRTKSILFLNFTLFFISGFHFFPSINDSFSDLICSFHISLIWLVKDIQLLSIVTELLLCFPPLNIISLHYQPAASHAKKYVN